MSEPQVNFCIPKVKRLQNQGCRNTTLPSSRNHHEILQIIQDSFLDSNYALENWIISSVDQVINEEFQKAFQEKRQELRSELNSSDVGERYAFAIVDSQEKANDVCQKGIITGHEMLTSMTLGKRTDGVHVWMYADVPLRWASKNIEHLLNKTAYLIVYKVMRGRVKPVTPAVRNDIEPTPNYECHISRETPKAAARFQQLVNCTQIFVYEYDEECLPSKHPRHCYPYAVVTCSKHGESNLLSPCSKRPTHPGPKKQQILPDISEVALKTKPHRNSTTSESVESTFKEDSLEQFPEFIVLDEYVSESSTTDSNQRLSDNEQSQPTVISHSEQERFRLKKKIAKLQKTVKKFSRNGNHREVHSSKDKEDFDGTSKENIPKAGKKKVYVGKKANEKLKRRSNGGKAIKRMFRNRARRKKKYNKLFGLPSANSSKPSNLLIKSDEQLDDFGLAAEYSKSCNSKFDHGTKKKERNKISKRQIVITNKESLECDVNNSALKYCSPEQPSVQNLSIDDNYGVNDFNEADEKVTDILGESISHLNSQVFEYNHSQIQSIIDYKHARIGCPLTSNCDDTHANYWDLPPPLNVIPAEFTCPADCGNQVLTSTCPDILYSRDSNLEVMDMDISSPEPNVLPLDNVDTFCISEDEQGLSDTARWHEKCMHKQYNNVYQDEHGRLHVRSVAEEEQEEHPSLSSTSLRGEQESTPYKSEISETVYSVSKANNLQSQNSYSKDSKNKRKLPKEFHGKKLLTEHSDPQEAYKILIEIPDGCKKPEDPRKRTCSVKKQSIFSVLHWSEKTSPSVSLKTSATELYNQSLKTVVKAVQKPQNEDSKVVSGLTKKTKVDHLSLDEKHPKKEDVNLPKKTKNIPADTTPSSNSIWKSGPHNSVTESFSPKQIDKKASQIPKEHTLSAVKKINEVSKRTENNLLPVIKKCFEENKTHLEERFKMFPSDKEAASLDRMNKDDSHLPSKVTSMQVAMRSSQEKEQGKVSIKNINGMAKRTKKTVHFDAKILKDKGGHLLKENSQIVPAEKAATSNHFTNMECQQKAISMASVSSNPLKTLVKNSHTTQDKEHKRTNEVSKITKNYLGANGLKVNDAHLSKSSSHQSAPLDKAMTSLDTLKEHLHESISRTSLSTDSSNCISRQRHEKPKINQSFVLLHFTRKWMTRCGWGVDKMKLNPDSHHLLAIWIRVLRWIEVMAVRYRDKGMHCFNFGIIDVRVLQYYLQRQEHSCNKNAQFANQDFDEEELESLLTNLLLVYKFENMPKDFIEMVCQLQSDKRHTNVEGSTEKGTHDNENLKKIGQKRLQNQHEGGHLDDGKDSGEGLSSCKSGEDDHRRDSLKYSEVEAKFEKDNKTIKRKFTKPKTKRKKSIPSVPSTCDHNTFISKDKILEILQNLEDGGKGSRKKITLNVFNYCSDCGFQKNQHIVIETESDGDDTSDPPETDHESMEIDMTEKSLHTNEVEILSAVKKGIQDSKELTEELLCHSHTSSAEGDQDHHNLKSSTSQSVKNDNQIIPVTKEISNSSTNNPAPSDCQHTQDKIVEQQIANVSEDQKEGESIQKSPSKTLKKPKPSVTTKFSNSDSTSKPFHRSETSVTGNNITTGQIDKPVEQKKTTKHCWDTNSPLSKVDVRSNKNSFTRRKESGNIKQSKIGNDDNLQHKDKRPKHSKELTEELLCHSQTLNAERDQDHHNLKSSTSQSVKNDNQIIPVTKEISNSSTNNPAPSDCQHMQDKIVEQQILNVFEDQKEGESIQKSPSKTLKKPKPSVTTFSNGDSTSKPFHRSETSVTGNNITTGQIEKPVEQKKTTKHCLDTNSSLSKVDVRSNKNSFTRRKESGNIKQSKIGNDDNLQHKDKRPKHSKELTEELLCHSQTLNAEGDQDHHNLKSSTSQSVKNDNQIIPVTKKISNSSTNNPAPSDCQHTQDKIVEQQIANVSEDQKEGESIQKSPSKTLKKPKPSVTTTFSNSDSTSKPFHRPETSVTGNNITTGQIEKPVEQKKTKHCLDTNSSLSNVDVRSNNNSFTRCKESGNNKQSKIRNDDNLQHKDKCPKHSKELTEELLCHSQTLNAEGDQDHHNLKSSTSQSVKNDNQIIPVTKKISNSSTNNPAPNDCQHMQDKILEQQIANVSEDQKEGESIQKSPSKTLKKPKTSLTTKFSNSDSTSKPLHRSETSVTGSNITTGKIEKPVEQKKTTKHCLDTNSSLSKVDVRSNKNSFTRRKESGKVDQSKVRNDDNLQRKGKHRCPRKSFNSSRGNHDRDTHPPKRHSNTEVRGHPRKPRTHSKGKETIIENNSRLIKENDLRYQLVNSRKRRSSDEISKHPVKRCKNFSWSRDPERRVKQKKVKMNSSIHGADLNGRIKDFERGKLSSRPTITKIPTAKLCDSQMDKHVKNYRRESSGESHGRFSNGNDNFHSVDYNHSSYFEYNAASRYEDYRCEDVDPVWHHTEYRNAERNDGDHLDAPASSFAEYEPKDNRQVHRRERQEKHQGQHHEHYKI